MEKYDGSGRIVMRGLPEEGKDYRQGMQKLEERSGGNGCKEKWKNLLENLFIVILTFYPLRHVYWGLDLWDTGYNYANFVYMGTEHMDPMWLFSTYLSSAVGHLFTKLPGAGSLVGMNFYTGLFGSLLALMGYWFCTRKLKMQFWLVFVGEMGAISLCWCPTALLYNYMTYALFLGCVILLYQGLTGERKGCLIGAGVCLGVNVLVRFSNLPEMAMILAVWVYDFIVWREEGKQRGSFWKRILQHTGWCLLGYAAALAVMYCYIHLRYGMGQYIEGISRLFAMTDDAADYKAAAMIRKMIDTYVENLYWAVRMALIAGVGTVLASAAAMVRRAVTGPSQEKMKKSRAAFGLGLKLLIYVSGVLLAGAMLVWLYRSGKFCSLEFYNYGSMLRPGVLFLMLTLLIAAIRIFHPGCRREEKLISGMLILVILLTSLGSNNGVFPSLNNLFVAAPYTLWESFRFIRGAGEKRIARVIINPFPAKCILTAFLLMCLFQFGGFGVEFVFAESTGVQDIGDLAENNEILKNVKMSEEKARWMTELTAYVQENELQGREVILYGYIPALSYYLQMPSAFNPWSDLASYSYEAMVEDMQELNGETPVIILENRCAEYLDGGRKALEDLQVEAAEVEKMVSDRKLLLLEDFMEENHYELTFRNEKFALYEQLD